MMTQPPSNYGEPAAPAAVSPPVSPPAEPAAPAAPAVGSFAVYKSHDHYRDKDVSQLVYVTGVDTAADGAVTVLATPLAYLDEGGAFMPDQLTW
jgi:hypothetical protein